MDEKQDMNFTNFGHLKLECENYDQYFLNATLLPAVCIILLLVFIQRRKKIFGFEENLWCLRGRCGFVVPVDFTSTLENRWSYAFGFGAVTQHMVSLIFGFTKPYPFVLPSYLKVFMYMMSALKVGVVCMPLFACLSTPCQLLGGVLGLLYSLLWVFLDLFELIWCFDSTADKGGIRYYLPKFEWLLDLPHLLCLSFLVLRFGHLIVTEILICLKKHHRKEESEKEHYLYVQRLLQRPTEKSVKKTWFQRKVYEWDPYFKFPNRIIATVVLSFLSLYMMMLLEQVLSTYILTGRLICGICSQILSPNQILKTSALR
ncbi:hypothetical protein HF521_015040 [Silurus meridionalis]|uniref:Uncharacterized protein n=1 Tax=Silurus meridionalis TaxID=175797 RepID=A0A8T0A6U9_SILME|nr:hypothetical protein HF521_015040 [Silurus meridionalis]